MTLGFVYIKQDNFRFVRRCHYFFNHAMWPFQTLVFSQNVKVSLKTRSSWPLALSETSGQPPWLNSGVSRFQDVLQCYLFGA